MKISIIMPVYNKEKYLRRAIESVLRCGFEDFELILVDDGSTDGSGEICREYADSDQRIKVIRKENGGVSSARNAGISCVSGEYMMFLDCDDELCEGALKELSETAERNGYPDVIFTPFYKIFPDGKKEKVQIPESGEQCREAFFKKYARIQPQNGFFGFVSNKLTKTSTIKGNDLLFDTEIKLCEDALFFMNVYDRCNSFFYSDTLSFLYYQCTEGSSVFMETDYISSAFVWNDIRKILVKHNVSADDTRKFDKQIAGFLYAALRFECRNKHDILSLSGKTENDVCMLQCLDNVGKKDFNGLTGIIIGLFKKKNKNMLILLLRAVRIFDGIRALLKNMRA